VYSAEVHVSVKDAVIGTDHQHLLVIEVTDCGAGFSAQVITGHPGTGGLGLVGVPERLKLIDGGVEVASVPGLGTRVTLTVPLMAPATPSAGELA
jgi:signal transduction histidine kinase